MTNEEAIKNLKKLKSFHNGSYGTAIDMAIKVLEQQAKMQDCEHCIHTYGTLGCCDMVHNEWVYDCEFGKEQYKKEYESQPCDDCISRKRLIILVDEGAELHPYKVAGDSETYSNYNQGWTDAFDWLYANIDSDNLPSVTPQTRWIPVTERLPDEGYSVLVMRITDDSYKYMRVATYQGDCWMDNTDEFNKPNPHKVIAWMPLPQPYAESEDEE